MLYEHVRLLRELGYDACVLHHHAPYRPAWRELEVPVRYLDEPGFAADRRRPGGGARGAGRQRGRAAHPWRRVVFVQGSFLILRGWRAPPTTAALGYEAAMAVLPHVARVVERHFGMLGRGRAAVHRAATSSRRPRPPRQPRVLLAVKDGYRRAGFPDEAIAGALLAKEIAGRPGLVAGAR